MSTQYPSDREEHYWNTENLLKKFTELQKQNQELNIALMRKSAEASDINETLKRWRLEAEILRDQKGHNLCHMGIPRLLKAILGTSEPYPDPDNISGEQFAYGCAAFHGDTFPDCGFRLQVIKIPEDLRNKGILTEDQSKKARDFLGFGFLKNEDEK